MFVSLVAVTVVVFGFTEKSQAILDFLGKKADDAISVSTYAESVTDLVSEFDTNSKAVNDTQKISAKFRSISSDLNEIRYIGDSTQILLEGPDWTQSRLEENIRSTTDFIRRAKNIMLRLKALGPQGITALNTFQTNLALNEVQKNQQLLIYQSEKQNISQAQKDVEEKRNWSNFMKEQRQYMDGQKTPLRK